MGFRPFGHLLFGVPVEHDVFYEDVEDELDDIEGITHHTAGSDGDSQIIVHLEDVELEAGYFTDKVIELPDNQLPPVEPARLQWFVQTLRQMGIHEQPKWLLTYTYL